MPGRFPARAGWFHACEFERLIPRSCFVRLTHQANFSHDLAPHLAYYFQQP